MTIHDLPPAKPVEAIPLMLRLRPETPEERERREIREARARWDAAHPRQRDTRDDGRTYDRIIRCLLIALQACDVRDDSAVFHLRDRFRPDRHYMAGLATDYAAEQYEFQAIQRLINEVVAEMRRRGLPIDPRQLVQVLTKILRDEGLREDVLQQIMGGIVTVVVLRRAPVAASAAAPARLSPEEVRKKRVAALEARALGPAPAPVAVAPAAAVPHAPAQHASEEVREKRLAALERRARGLPPAPVRPGFSSAPFQTGVLDALEAHRQAMTALYAEVGRQNQIRRDFENERNEFLMLAQDVERMLDGIAILSKAHEQQLAMVQHACRQLVAQGKVELSKTASEEGLRNIRSINRRLRQKIDGVATLPPPKGVVDRAALEWAGFVAQITTGWVAYRDSGWSLHLRGANNHREYVVPESVRRRLRGAGGTIVIGGAVYRIQNSLTAGVSLHRTPHNGSADYIFHL